MHLFSRNVLKSIPIGLALFAAIGLSQAGTATAQVLNAGCPAEITWIVGDSDTIPIVDILFVDSEGETIATLAIETENDGVDSLLVPCVAEGEYAGMIRVVGNGATISEQPATLLAVPPTIELNAEAGAVGDTCRSLVTFGAVVTDDCGVDADGVSVSVTLAEDNAILDGLVIDKTMVGDSVIVSGSLYVSALTGSPAIVKITVTGTDGCELAHTDSISVEVIDDIKPVVMCPADATVECSESGGTPATHPEIVAFLAAATATDNCDPDPALTNDAPDFFPLGETLVTFTATDASGNDSSCTAILTIEDTTPPNMIVALNRYFLWPPNHKMRTITADIAVSDDCDPDATFRLISVESSEPDNGRGDGNTSDDVQGVNSGTDDASFSVRSERAGPGEGRVYTVIYEAFDTSGNSSRDTSHVIVPHDQSGKARASNGFEGDGKGLETADGGFAVIIPSWTDNAGRSIDATALQLFRAQISNDEGAIAAAEVYVGDVDGNLRDDAVLVFSSGAIDALGLRSPGKQKNVMLHYADRSGDNWTIDDIFNLGQPLAVDYSALERIEEGGTGTNPGDGDTGGSDDPGAPVEKPGALTGPLAKRMIIAPNPFRPMTVLRYRMPIEGNVSIRVYDVTGRPVATLVDRFLGVGDHSITWDGRNRAGQRLTPGVYMVRINGGGPAQTSKIIMLE